MRTDDNHFHIISQMVVQQFGCKICFWMFHSVFSIGREITSADDSWEIQSHAQK